MSERWTPDSWRAKPIQQVPAYPDAAALASGRAAARRLSAAGLRRRGAQAEAARWPRSRPGEAFLLQGGDCAESFAEHSRRQHPRLLPRLPADGGGPDLRRRLAGGEGRPHRRPVRQAALGADREGRRRRAAELSRRHHQRHRIHAGSAHSRSAPPDRGLSPVGRDPQPDPRLRDRRLRQPRECAPLDARLREGYRRNRRATRSSPTASPRASTSCAPSASIPRPIRKCARPISTPATRRCCSATSRR